MVWVSRFASVAGFWIIGIAIHYPSLHDPYRGAQMCVPNLLLEDFKLTTNVSKYLEYLS